MKGQRDEGKGRGANPSCHLPNSSIAFLISLSPSALHSGCQTLSLKCISVSLQIKFSPVPSLSHSIISSIPSPFFCIFSSVFLFPLPSVSSIKTRYYTPPPNSKYSPHPPLEKVKIYKTVIFRFMCHSQKKYNHGCVEGDRRRNRKMKRTGDKICTFAVDMHLGKIHSRHVHLFQ